MKKIKKILILGSGALKIWEAGEFDYSGSQAIKAVKEEGIKTVLVNPNIATVQTDPGFADTIYFLPVTPYFVEKIIAKEKPDSIMLSFGWQTALNCWLELENSWILAKYGVQVLWTPVSTIEMTEDRKKFNETLDQIEVKYARSKHASNEEEALKVAKKIGYPLLVRAAFTLGWLGSWFANNEKELKKLLKKSFSYSSQVIIDESLKGWKEVEYEVVRDKSDNCITVCNMENFDPMGIHTWESIVFSPSQTLSNEDYHFLREVSIKTIRHLGIVWECNIQYAYNPKATEYRVIEVNARLSRSSALASKATGYPLAYVAAKIGLGYTLDEIDNSITKVTKAFFEPALDYVVVKFPKWDLQKFEKVSQVISSEMKSVGEVMMIGKSIEEVFQKVIRSLDIWANGLVCTDIEFRKLEKELQEPTPSRVFAVVLALKKGMSLDKVHSLTGIDVFFLSKIKNVIDTETLLSQKIGTRLWVKDMPLLQEAKKQWFSDKQVEIITGIQEESIRKFRFSHELLPVVKQIDTLGWEFAAQTNYLYTTYSGTEDDLDFSPHPNPLPKGEGREKVLVIGSGAYRIGSSVEFDWCCVNTLKTLRKNGYETLFLNCNPETVSTDYEESDKLYFDEINLERVLDICEKEQPMWVIISMWGQTANNLAIPLKKAGIPILGTDPKYIDNAEDRNKFSALLDKIDVDQPKWTEVSNIKDSLDFANKVWFPVLIRPSYVLSGANMRVCSNSEQLQEFLEKKANVSKDHPTVISKFQENSKELEIDGVAKDGKLVIYAIWEHIENAWVHSWDATIVLPAQFLYVETIRRVKNITKKIIKELNITGPFNIQFLAKHNDIKVIECNLRASRSFPFVSKVTKFNFIEIAVEAILGKENKNNYNTLDLDYVWVKASQFSFHRLKGADPKLGIEMASTWEVGCIWSDIHQAFLKSIMSVGTTIPEKNILLSIGKLDDKIDFLETAKTLSEKEYVLYATPKTHEFLEERWIKTKKLYKSEKHWDKTALSYLQNGKIDFIINSPKDESKKEDTFGYLLRRSAVDLSVPIITNIKLAKLFVESIEKIGGKEGIEIKSYEEF